MNAIVRASDNTKTLGIVHRTQFEAGGIRRWIALGSVLLILTLHTLEVAHTHAAASGSATRCTIWISIAGNAPAAPLIPSQFFVPSQLSRRVVNRLARASPPAPLY